MKPEIKTKWVTALRSGKFEQVESVLCENISEKKLGYCCLGVLTRLYCEENGISIKKGVKPPLVELSVKKEGSMPAAKVLNWAGLHHKTADTLANQNDSGRYTFKDIADYIEKKL